MTIGIVAMLVGLFVVPVVLLLAGHRLRRRSPARRRMFWGALAGYGVASVAALWAGMSPAAMWASGDTVRGFLGFWLLLVGPAVGALVGAIWRRTDER